MTSNSSGNNAEHLIRAIGLRGIVALTINGIIGGGIFALPASAAALLGNFSPVAFVAAGFFAICILLCFVELGSRYDRTGGAYLYATEAYPPIVSFLIGWMYFLARLTSTAALAGALPSFVEFFVPLAPVWQKILTITALALLGLVNIRGVKISSRLINFFAVAKLLPLTLLILVGLFVLHRYPPLTLVAPPIEPFARTVLLAMYVFSGFEIVPVPAAEIVRPEITVPRGLLIGTGFTILIYFLIQVVSVTVTPGLASYKAPLTQTALLLMGTRGAILLSAGAIVSSLGTMMAVILVGPRILYAMAIGNQMPSVFKSIHPRYNTPALAIILFIVLAMVISLSGSFTMLATLSAMARMLTYIGTAGALLILRRKLPEKPAFRIAGGPLIPILTILISAGLLLAATKIQWITGLSAVAVGFLIYGFTLAARRS